MNFRCISKKRSSRKKDKNTFWSAKKRYIFSQKFLRERTEIKVVVIIFCAKMNKILILVVLCSIFGYVKSDCENGALQSIVNSSICYSFVSEPSEFIEAEISCQSSGGHLASISDGFTNVLLARKI